MINILLCIDFLSENFLAEVICKEGTTDSAKERNKKRSSSLTRAIPSTSNAISAIDIYSASMNYLNEQNRLNNLHKSNSDSIQYSGDILTRVAIPRSGSFLNAGGLARYKVSI